MSPLALGRLVRMIRECLELTYYDLADESLSPRFWEALERGEFLPTPIQVRSILDVLEDVDVERKQAFLVQETGGGPGQTNTLGCDAESCVGDNGCVRDVDGQGHPQSEDTDQASEHGGTTRSV